MAERLGRSLQNFVQWFKSAYDLQKRVHDIIKGCPLCAHIERWSLFSTPDGGIGRRVGLKNR